MRFSRLTLALGGAFALALAGCTPASKAPEAKPMTDEQRLEAAKSLFEKVSQGRGTVYEVAPAPDGLYRLKIGPKDMTPQNSHLENYAWMSSNAKVVILGPAFDENRTDLSATEAKASAASEPAATTESEDVSPKVTKLKEQLLTRAASKDSGSFIQGTKGPVVTAIIDLNCSHCNDFVAAIQPAIKAGKLRVRYVVAGFLNATSERKAAAVLTAKDPVAALLASEEAFRRDGGDDSIGRVDDSKLAVVKANTKILAETQEPSTPYLFYCDKARKQVIGMPGYEPNLDAFTNAIGTEGHPACAK